MKNGFDSRIPLNDQTFHQRLQPIVGSQDMVATPIELFKVAYPGLLHFAFLNTLRRELAGCRSCLDIGCGSDSPIRFLRLEYTLGVDGYEPMLEDARRQHTHNDFLLADARDLDRYFSPRQFDCCVAIDLIEHLTKQDGLKLIKSMERIAAKKVLLFTPNGFLPQHSHDGDLQEHLSGWSADEMRRLGFRVYGMLGWKRLRGEYHQHRMKLKRLSGVLSLLSHVLFTRRHPQHAAALLCVKSIEREKGADS